MRKASTEGKTYVRRGITQCRSKHQFQFSGHGQRAGSLFLRLAECQPAQHASPRPSLGSDARHLEKLSEVTAAHRPILHKPSRSPFRPPARLDTTVQHKERRYGLRSWERVPTSRQKIFCSGCPVCPGGPRNNHEGRTASPKSGRQTSLCKTLRYGEQHANTKRTSMRVWVWSLQKSLESLKAHLSDQGTAVPKAWSSRRGRGDI